MRGWVAVLLASGVLSYFALRGDNDSAAVTGPAVRDAHSTPRAVQNSPRSEGAAASVTSGDDEQTYAYIRTKVGLTGDIAEQKRLLESYLANHPRGMHVGEAKALLEDAEKRLEAWQERQRVGTVRLSCFVTLGNGQTIPVQGWVQLLRCSRTTAEIWQAASADTFVAATLGMADRIRAVGGAGSEEWAAVEEASYLSYVGAALGKELRGSEVVGMCGLENGQAIFTAVPPGVYCVYGAGRAGLNAVGYYDFAVVAGGDVTRGTPSSLSCFNPQFDPLKDWVPVGTY